VVPNRQPRRGSGRKPQNVGSDQRRVPKAPQASLAHLGLDFVGVTTRCFTAVGWSYPHVVRQVLAVLGIAALALVACSGAEAPRQERASAGTRNESPSGGLRAPCSYLALSESERLGVFKKVPTSNQSAVCTYVEEPAMAGDPTPIITVSLRTRGGAGGGSASFRKGDIVTGLGAPAVWLPDGKTSTAQPPPGHTATTSSTALGTANPVSGKLVVKPQDYLLVISVSGMHNNPEEAKLAAQLILARL
jgi:hypothetical protein